MSIWESLGFTGNKAKTAEMEAAAEKAIQSAEAEIRRRMQAGELSEEDVEKALAAARERDAAGKKLDDPQ